MLGFENQLEKLKLRNAFELRNSAVNFKWDHTKYLSTLPIKEIADSIEKQLNRAEDDVKKRGSAYQELTSALNLLEVKKNDDSLAANDLDEILKPDDFQLVSEHFRIDPVLVPKLLKNDFLNTYTSFAPMVVPESAAVLLEDQQYCVFKVAMFKTCYEEFKIKAAEKK